MNRKFERIQRDSSYIQFHKIYHQFIKSKELEKNGRLKIGLLSSFSLIGFEECLNVWCNKYGFNCEIYIGPYGQYNQQIYNNQSKLYKFDPDAVFLLLDVEHLFKEFFKRPYTHSAEERQSKVRELVDDVSNMLLYLAERSESKIIMNNLEVPVYSPLGLLENKENYGLIKIVKEFNTQLEDTFRESNRIYVFDYDLFTSKYGKDNCTDPRMKYLADMRVPKEIVPKLCYNYLSYLLPMLGLNRKCIVLDLDNTLWGGIIGEDEFENIALGPDPLGSVFVDFQKKLLALYDKGILLAINSNNNLEDALKVIKEHPYMVLKEEHFAGFKVNWKSKVLNIKEIADDLNIGLDSMVFIDDDPVNREMMRKFYPEVLTMGLPSDPSQYSKTLENLIEFNTLQLTEADKRRGKMYVEQRYRREFESSVTNMQEFLKGLEMEIEIEPANRFNIPRIGQLTQRTNQFNLTTKRYQEEDITKFSKSDEYEVYSLRLKDKFGEYGLIGVLILKRETDITWTIDTFLLSCRAMGKNVEKAFFTYIVNMLEKKGISKLRGIYLPTNKNIPVKNLYKELGFTKIEESPSRTVWLLDCKNYDESIAGYIKIIE